MNWLYTLLIVVHVSSIIAVVSASLIHIIGHNMGEKPADVVAIQQLGAQAGSIWASAGAMSLLITGSILVTISNNRLVGWDKLWVWISIALWVLASVIGSVFSARAGRQMMAELNGGNITAAAATGNRLLTFAWLNIAIVVAIIALMFFKPGALAST